METNETHELLPVVIAADQQAIIAMAEAAIDAHPRYELAGITSNAAMATQLSSHVKPAVVVMAECLRGSSTNDAVEYLHLHVPTCEVILLCSDGNNVRGLDLVENIFAAVGIDDVHLFQRALNSVAQFLDGAADLDSPDRRLRDDHRFHADWNTISSDRRETGRRSIDKRRTQNHAGDSGDLAVTEF